MLLAAFGGEVVGLVASPATGEVDTQAAVALAEVFGVEHHLVAGKELRDAAHGGQHGDGELGLVVVAPYHIAQAVGVVVAGKDEHVGEVVVEEVV